MHYLEGTHVAKHDTVAAQGADVGALAATALGHLPAAGAARAADERPSFSGLVNAPKLT